MFNHLSNFNKVDLEQQCVMYQNNEESSNQDTSGGALLRAAECCYWTFLLTVLVQKTP